MSPSADFVQLSNTATRRVGTQPGPSAQSMAQQRSEFEDFMNAYRPTLEVSKQGESCKSSNHDVSKTDFGRSIKKLMKKTQPPPLASTSNKNHKKESQRLPPPRDRSVANELKPLPVSHVKKASRPGSVIIESSSQPSLPFPPKAPAVVAPAAVAAETNPLPKAGSSQDQQKLTSEPLPTATVNSPSPVSIRRKLSIQESHKETMLMTSSQPSTPTVERDAPCVLIARNCIGRFLPPRRNPDPLMSLRVVEVPDRKYRVILEFEESPMADAVPISNSGLAVASPECQVLYSRGCWDQMEAFAWLRESRIAASGMLLINVERCTEFPYVTYLLLSGGRNELCQKVNQMRNRPLPPHHNQLHFVAGYEETASVCRPPFPLIPEKPSSDRSGFVVFLYQVLPGDDSIRFEQNWVMWTGARQLYMHAPDYMGFKRLSILKSVLPTQVIIYAMLCEFSAIMDYLTEACVLVDKLRARCCGFTGIYRVLDSL